MISEWQKQLMREARIVNVERDAPARCVPLIVRLRATIEGLETAYIPFAVLQENPLEKFEGETLTYEEWQRLFIDLRPDQVFFLVAWSSVPQASRRLVEAAAFMIGIATPGPLRKRWLTTFAVQRRGAFAAWCEEIDMAQVSGQLQISEIVLSQENMLRFENAGGR
jgi:hypothetical protein